MADHPPVGLAWRRGAACAAPDMLTGALPPLAASAFEVDTGSFLAIRSVKDVTDRRPAM